MKEISDVKSIPETQEAKPLESDIKIKPIGEMSDHQADDIFDKICEDEFEPPELPILERNHEDDESGRIDIPKDMSLKKADELFKKLFDSDDVEDDFGNNTEAEKESDRTEVADDSSDAPEYNEDGTRELTEDEKQYLKDKLGWSDEKLKKCTIDENGVIHYKTDRSDLEGKTSENGVPYERRTIEINGVKIEGVFPKFDSAFDTELAPENYKSKAYAKECNAKLKEAVENDPELRSKFTEEQLKDIEEGRTPTGYVWHHNEEPGKMQLVKREDHDRAIGGAAHTGGNSLWGADSVDNSKKGESF